MIAIRSDDRCSFCNKPKAEVEQLLAPAFASSREPITVVQVEGVAICNECVDGCRAIIIAEREHRALEASTSERT